MSEPGYFDRYKPVDVRRDLETVSDQHYTDFSAHIVEALRGRGECKVLDIGCGNSTFSNELSSLHPEADFYTIDVVEDKERGYVPQLRNANVHFVNADGNFLPFSDDSFDLVVATWSVSAYLHQQFPVLERTYIEEVGRVLRPGGLASLRPEASWFAFATLDKFLQGADTAPDLPCVQRKAAGYLSLREQGFLVQFLPEPNRARITAPVSKPGASA